MTSKLTREEMQELISALRLTPTSTVNGISLGRLADALSENEAAMDSEPVAYMYRDNLHSDARFSLESKIGNWSPEDINEYEISETPLYLHAQQPRVPDVMEPTIEAIKRILPTSNPDEYAACIGADMWNACRAAMLQGADGKPELTVWYGAMPETNGKTNWTAILHREGQHPLEGITIDRSEYPDRVRYEADRMRHLIGELADEPDILAYDAEAHSGYVYPGNSPVIPGAEQRISDAVDLLKKAAPAMLADNGGPDGPLAGRMNSPVIPDGYVMVPKEPTPEMLAVINEAIKSMRGSAATYARVLAAAPQEVRGE
ncbi:hypothetical protein [Raoultella ornithinolytica]|uniref:hypothetical protein n=1 Tax=Raoultella ornithinolytica TaxID=54291 RepID=UPI001F409547|nr:hypothetical protein [Raoultella ornithinolytica]MCF1305002.1 hypothetical protein [Raoultella ornithinolytica]